MRSVLALTLLALSACGQSPTPVTVDPALAPYTQSFQTDIGASSAGISAQFADTTTIANPLGETVGACLIWSDGTRLIQVDPTYWSTLTQSGRIELMYHELGHCALNLPHIFTSNGPGGCPTSIMWPQTFGVSPCFTMDEPYYFQELGSHRN